MAWDLSTVADVVGDALRDAEAGHRLEQAVYGIDSLDELPLQSLLAAGLATRYEVAREIHYPGTAGRKKSHRQRCDLVLGPKGRPVRLDTAPPDLFTPTDLCEPGEALWLEVKVARQFKLPGVRHSSYGAQWRQKIVDDLRKMEDESLIKEAGLLFVVFCESNEILEKDLQLFEDVLVRKEVLAGFRQVRTTPLLDRMGHTLAAAALWPTIQR
jgi:hypothetical protein